MRQLLASPRRRRRAAWITGGLLAAGLVSLLGIEFANTGRHLPDTFRPGKPQLVAPAPKRDPFTVAERRQVQAVASRFVATAVFRKNVDDSWEITTPSLHQGISRSAWASGAIPIVPYPPEAVALVRWRVNYSYVDSVALKVAIYPKPKAQVERQVFDIELENHGTAAAPRWLVSYWAPSGGPQLAAAGPGSPPIDPATSEGTLGAVWLFVPFVLIVGSLLAVIVFLAVRGRLRHLRAERTYSSNSSPS